ncbi:MAG TPA: hypothetical protein VFN97_26890, partial [Actinospica sp.]|nr:hypothetical protein [Actinospica sp.]
PRQEAEDEQQEARRRQYLFGPSELAQIHCVLPSQEDPLSAENSDRIPQRADFRTIPRDCRAVRPFCVAERSSSLIKIKEVTALGGPPCR